MAKQTLPTNFKDDVLASSMGGKRRYILTENGDGTFSLEDATSLWLIRGNQKKKGKAQSRRNRRLSQEIL